MAACAAPFASSHPARRSISSGAFARVAAGAPVSAYLAFEHTAYRVTKDEITKFASSPRTTRGFCRTCGSTLMCESASRPAEAHFHVGGFDRTEQFRAPTRHVFRDEQLPWLHPAEEVQAASA